MQVIQNRWLPALLVVACVFSAGNAALYWSLSARFKAVEGAIAAMATPPGAMDASRDKGAAQANDGHASQMQTARLGAMPGPDEQIRQLKQQKASYDPGSAAAKLDRMMALEPSLPSVEQTQVRLLQQAVQNMPADAPQATGLQTSCHGRRCLISAGFADDLQASDWANRLLLVGGKNLPKSARIVAVPLEGGNGAVSMQLYLY